MSDYQDEEENEEEIEEAWDAGLKAKVRLFVLHYCTDQEAFLNGSVAYKKTYTKKDRQTGELVIPEPATCDSNASRLLKRPQVKAAVKKLLKLTQPELDEQNTYKMIQELAELAFYNPADILNADGSLKVDNLMDLGSRAKCISQITRTQYGMKYTLYDRNKAIDKHLVYLNIVRPEVPVEINLPVIRLVNKAKDIDSWNEMASKE